MKKIIAIFGLVLLMATLIGCTDSKAEDAGLPTARVLESYVHKNKATFNINLKNAETADAILFDSSDEVKASVTLNKGANDNVEFSNLMPKTNYSVKIISGTREIKSINIETGSWIMNAPTASITTSVDGGDATINYEVNDEDNTISSLSLRVLKGVTVVNQRSISVGQGVVEISGLEASTGYKVMIVADYNLGQKNEIQQELATNTVTTNEVDKIVEFDSINTVQNSISSNDLVDVEVTLKNDKEAQINALVVNGIRVDSSDFIENTSTKITFKMLANWRITLEAIEYNDGFKDSMIYINNVDGKSNFVDVNIEFEDVTIDNETYYIIKNYRDMESISQDLTANYILDNDIVFPYGYKIYPIGYQKNESFSGIFDGAGKKIVGMSFKENLENIALFAKTSQATFKDLNLEYSKSEIYLRGNIVRFSSLVAYAENTTFQNIDTHYEATVLSYGFSMRYIAGGVVGEAKGGTIIDCSSDSVAYVLNSGAEAYIGGIVGKATNTTISNVTAKLDRIQASRSVYFGGIAGGVDADYKNNKTSDISNANAFIDELMIFGGTFGAIVGVLGTNTTIDNAIGLINDIYTPYTSNYTLIGGVAGLTNGKISNSTGSISSTRLYSGSEQSVRIGGVTGAIQTDIDNPDVLAEVIQSVGNVSVVGVASSYVYIGGVAGEVYDGKLSDSKGHTEAIASGYYVYLGGTVGTAKGSKSIIDKVEGSVQKSIITSVYGSYIGGAVGFNGEGANVSNMIGSMLDNRIMSRELKVAVLQDVAVGGSVGYNSGVAKYIVGSIENTIIDSYSDIDLGGVVGYSASNDITIFENSLDGGVVDGGLALKLDVIIKPNKDVEVYYGNVSGGHAVSETLITNTYYLSNGIFNIQNEGNGPKNNITIGAELGSLIDLGWSEDVWDMSGQVPVFVEGGTQ